MNRNPLIPFAIIAVIAIIATIGMSYYGLNNADKLLAAMEAGETETAETDTAAADDPEGLYKVNCAACHGQNLEGGVGLPLDTIGSKLSAEEIANIITNGQVGDSIMPPMPQVDDATKEQISTWLAEKK
ncbi:c-type cytochrome [Calidifontibacillus oryziterrae]|uniref:c-type cytochrome n=1 Tax=Calidifontibacillus oryziterrae TaxID=1191699 RepID=UPI0002DDFD1F|nr:cytochrome c [Calidifontibacillus oryziterrae]